MLMFNQPHPAEIIREDILPELGLSVTEAAKQLGVNRVTLSRLLNGKSAISADMAIRLHTWLGENSPSPESWLHQQADYDLWQAQQKINLSVIPVHSQLSSTVFEIGSK
ncbi:HigA family addiction module antitoxin [Caviibacterium pharyngocola]|uniref:Addiction module antidote protein, HigA family n=1 Tax=Caviibacterium pharyngocola TaxID=28159 RepID=A0A2M8RW74_9PAST|nr:HigA family addiction module antitoxin [Caviibacterium pharyngocola]PJG83134.1 addiction module antidote protein, HigA family [Caviibacterium pharyngocola]